MVDRAVAIQLRELVSSDDEAGSSSNTTLKVEEDTSSSEGWVSDADDSSLELPLDTLNYMGTLTRVRCTGE